MSAGIELEALVAHVYVVSGRAVGSPPPGTLAVTAPKRAPRPRQDETLFTLLVPNGAVKAQAQLYQTLAQQAADYYFKTSGGITGGLREALTQLNHQILAEQKKLMQPLRVSMLCAVMHEEEVYLARCGPMSAIFRSDSEASLFPADRQGNLQLTTPLGASMEPRVELTRYDLTPNSLLVLLDDGFVETPDDDLVQAVKEAEEIGALLEPLRRLVKSPLGHATVIQFVTHDTPTPEPVALPTRPQTPTPSLLAPEPDEAEKPEEVEPPTESESAAEELPADPSPSPPKRATQDIKKGVAKVLSSVAETTTKVGDTIFPEEPEETDDDEDEDTQTARYPLLANLAVMTAFLIPLVVVVVVVGLALSGEGNTAFEICRPDVLSLRDAARQLTPTEGEPITDQNTALAREQWILVREEALACERTKPGDEEMLFAAGEAQNNLDRFDRVTRRDVTPLRRFEENAELRGPVSGNWITIYSLDRAGDEVYKDLLSNDGQTLVEVSDEPIIFKGQNIQGEIVGDLVDIEWVERGGLPSGNSNVPIAMDESGMLVWYSETFGESERLRLVTPETWTRPIAMAVWRLNLYILDPPAQQIWRYVPLDGLYSELPEEYFSGEERPDLTRAIDFGIDEDGSVYILLNDGSVNKYRGGVQQPFDLFNLPDGALTSGTSLFVDNNPISRGLVVTDNQSETLYTMSLGGTINVGYRPLNDLRAFEQLSGAIVNPDQNSIYVLAGQFMYHMPRQ